MAVSYFFSFLWVVGTDQLRVYSVCVCVCVCVCIRWEWGWVWSIFCIGSFLGGVLLGGSGQAAPACCATCLCKPTFHGVNLLHSFFFPGQPENGTQNLPRCDSTKLILPFSVFSKHFVYLVPLWYHHVSVPFLLSWLVLVCVQLSSVQSLSCVRFFVYSESLLDLDSLSLYWQKREE